jgi:hypothetical protein
MGHGASDFFAFARTTSAVFAAVGQADALADTSAQDGFPGLYIKLATAGLNTDMERHLLSLWFCKGDYFAVKPKSTWRPACALSP